LFDHSILDKIGQSFLKPQLVPPPKGNKIAKPLFKNKSSYVDIETLHSKSNKKRSYKFGQSSGDQQSDCLFVLFAGAI
jgi:hypothetical protein